MEGLGASDLMACRFEDWPFSWSVREISDRHTISPLDEYPTRLLCMRRHRFYVSRPKIFNFPLTAIRAVSPADVIRRLSGGKGILEVNHQKGGGYACP